LEGALNIDRESFNTAHPHYQVLANWVHNSLGLIRNTLKALQSGALRDRRAQHQEESEERFTTTVEDLLRQATDSDPGEVPEVVLVENAEGVEGAAGEGKIAYVRSEIIPPRPEKPRNARVESRAAAVARILEAYGVLKKLNRSEQTRLVAAIVKIFTVDE
jgi:hypothetical protein